MKLVISFILLFQVAFAVSFTYPDFKQCFAKNKKSFVYFGELRAIAVGKYLAVAYSKTKPTYPFIKHDPFLNLYLFKSKKPLRPVKLKSTHGLKVGEWIAGMDEQSLFAGNFAKSGDVLNSMYLQNAKIDPNSIVSCLCCEVYGLGLGEGQFIGSEYIKRFINSKSVQYGDIGVRFIQRGDKFFIEKVDPFYTKSPFKEKDQVLNINGKKIYSLKDLNQKVLFANIGSKITLDIMRDGKKIKLNAKVVSRNGGGELQDSFLEKKGVYLTKKMKIKALKKGTFGVRSGLKVGDKLLQVDQNKVTNPEELSKFLSMTKKKSVLFLFDRDNFQFFVTVPLK